MKAEAIQIHDWVKVFGRNGNPSAEPHWYTREVTSDWIVHMERHASMLDKMRAHGLVIDEPQIGDTEPIPLTEETLVENGFEVKEKAIRNAVINKITDNAIITVLLIGNGFVLNIETCIEFDGTYATDNVHKCGYYVHELQHALRLCGLHEVANSFHVPQDRQVA